MPSAARKAAACDEVRAEVSTGSTPSAAAVVAALNACSFDSDVNRLPPIRTVSSRTPRAPRVRQR